MQKDTEGIWTLIAPPDNAVAYRKAAASEFPHITSNIERGEWGHMGTETWLENEDGGRILCLTDGPPTDAWASHFWIFEGATTDIADSGSWITVG